MKQTAALADQSHVDGSPRLVEPRATASPASANPNVYECIAAVSAEIAQTGISKARKNVQQGYQFRGIDDVYNALAAILAKHRLVILPRMLTRSQVERATAKGGVLFYTVVEAEFDFVSAADGSTHTVRTFGEAMDSGDKSTNKAMSAAYKYAAMQTFCIPTEGDHDTENTTHEDIVPATDDAYQSWLADLEIVAGEQGFDKLVAAVKASPREDWRARLRTDSRTWAALKAKAEAVAVPA